MPLNASEVNFDALVGPTHNYAGLSRGNLASEAHGGQISQPRRAALQGLAKMKLLADLGVAQAVLPPHDRPDVALLRRLGFDGSDAQVVERAHRESPGLLAAAGSASAMWAANAATVSPAGDTADGRVHLTAANLVTNLHRAIEAPMTGRILRAVFPDGAQFVVHDPLPACDTLADEGGANHTRLCGDMGGPGIELFHFGRSAGEPAGPARHPARQSRQASEAIARSHLLDPGRAFFIQQHPAAIDAGVFHNDVIAVGHRDLILHHESAYAGGACALDGAAEAYARVCGGPLRRIVVTEAEVPLAQAVASYVFNSQVVDLPGNLQDAVPGAVPGAGAMVMICPAETQEFESTRRLLARLASPGGPMGKICVVDLRQSMRNGGGPACLRLRVVLTERQVAGVHPGVFLTAELHSRLAAWVERHYRDELAPDDLRDPRLLGESRAALDELTRLLGLGTLYDFQR